MEKEDVIAFRDALTDGGENRAIVIAFDNGINVSLSSDIVFWDDENGRVVALTSDSSSGSHIAGLPIRIICSSYGDIQFMMSNTAVKIKNEYAENYKLEDLKKQLDNLRSIVSITEDQEKQVIDWYSKLYNPNYELSRTAYKPVDFRRGNKMVKFTKDEEEVKDDDKE